MPSRLRMTKTRSSSKTIALTEDTSSAGGASEQRYPETSSSATLHFVVLRDTRSWRDRNFSRSSASHVSQPLLLLSNNNDVLTHPKQRSLTLNCPNQPEELGSLGCVCPTLIQVLSEPAGPLNATSSLLVNPTSFTSVSSSSGR